jgi:hypothetical protein
MPTAATASITIIAKYIPYVVTMQNLTNPLEQEREQGPTTSFNFVTLKDPVALFTAAAMMGTAIANPAAPNCMYDMNVLVSDTDTE